MVVPLTVFSLIKRGAFNNPSRLVGGVLASESGLQNTGIFDRLNARSGLAVQDTVLFMIKTSLVVSISFKTFAAAC